MRATKTFIGGQAETASERTRLRRHIRSGTLRASGDCTGPTCLRRFDEGDADDQSVADRRSRRIRHARRPTGGGELA